jgi:hypothetical protein
MIEQERQRRINVAAWAYAYEIENDPIVTDAVYDEEAAKIDPTVRTGNDALDEFFASEFEPYTDAWVHRHPGISELPRICAIMRKGI